MYGWTLHKYVHFHMDELQIGAKHTNICRREKGLGNHFFYILPFEFEFSWFSVHPVGYGWKPSVQVEWSARLLRRGGHQGLSSSSSASSSASRSVLLLRWFPHSISHPFLDLKSLTIPHSCEVQKLKTYIEKKTTSLWGSFTEFNCFFPSFSIDYLFIVAASVEKKLSRIISVWDQLSWWWWWWW